MRITDTLSAVARALPRGDALPEQSWRRRHLGICVLLWAHVLFIPWFGTITGNGFTHSLGESLFVVALAMGATMTTLGRSARSVLGTVGLVSCSAILTHLSGGLIEMHFHFFVVVAIVTLYQSWLPFGVALAYVVVHHGVAGALDPTSVYNHPSALASPWKWAFVHGIFILGESTACLIAWRLNEDAIASERSTRGALEKANEDLAQAQELSHIGSWDWDLTTSTLLWSDASCSLTPWNPRRSRIASLVRPWSRSPRQPRAPSPPRTGYLTVLL